MKYLILSAIILSFVIIAACSRWKEPKGPPNITAVTVLYDITDPLLSPPDTNSIKEQFSELQADNSTGAILHTALLTDIPYSPEQQVEIKPQNYLLSNPGQRQEAVHNFFSQVEQAITQLKNNPTGFNHSDLFGPIARQANLLSQLPAKHKLLIIYSNLYENDAFSVYRVNDLELLSTHPDEVKKILLAQQALNNLSGITVKIIYQPTDYADGMLFTEVAAVYQQIFMEAGAASVTISANLSN